MPEPEERKEFCPNCKKEVMAKYNGRDNGEGEYKCPECSKNLIRIKRRDSYILF